MSEVGQDHWASFGDGNAAAILESRDYIKSNGLRYVKFIFIPSRLIEQMYNLSGEQDQISGAIVREFKKTDVLFLERGITRTRCWIKTDFNGGETTASRETKHLTEALNDTERLLRSSEAAKNRAYHELDMERQQQTEALKRKTDMVREVARARGKVESDSDSSSMELEDE